MNFRDRTQGVPWKPISNLNIMRTGALLRCIKNFDSSRAGYEKREKRRQIRKLQDAITAEDVTTVAEILRDDFDVDFQYRGKTALQQAVSEGQLAICELLIKKGADVNVCNAELSTLLHMACQFSHESIAKLLLQNGANIDALGDSNTTPISVCAAKGEVAIAKLLVTERCDLNIPNLKGETPLLIATKYRHAEMVEYLICSNCGIDLGDENSINPFITAAREGYIDVLKILISHGAQVNFQDRLGCTPLYHAVAENQIEIVRELIKHPKILLDQPATKGLTPLLVAITTDCMDIAMLLLEAGCDINKKDRMQNAPIHAAVRQVSLVFGGEEKAMDVVKKIVDLGCNIDVGDIESKTPLILSAFAGSVELTELFLKKNADLTKCTKDGDNALHAACRSIKSNVEVVNLLIRAGCRINDTNNNGEIPLFSALFHRADIKIIKELVKNGSDLNHREKTQQLTPLHEAIIQHMTEAAIFLIDSGCDVNVPNKQLQQPLYTACEKGNVSIVQYLLHTGKCYIDGLVPTAIPLHVAIVNNHRKIVESLVKAGCNLNKMNEKCLTPIMFTTSHNETDLAKVLLKYGCDLDAHAKVKGLMKCCLTYRDDKHPHFELEPLFFAVTHKNAEAIELFIQCYYRQPPYWVMELLIKFVTEIRQLNTHMTQAQKKEIIDILKKACEFPRSLQQICRGCVREKLGNLPQEKVDKLSIATKIKDYILMKEMFPEEDITEEEISDEEREMGRFR